MSLRARTSTTPSNIVTTTTATSNTSNSDDDSASDTTPKQQPPLAPIPSFSQRAISQTLTSTANLAKLLPTGTLLAFQLLTPIFTANGTCDSATRCLTLLLLALLAGSCFLASFTDSFKSPNNGQVFYGLATFKGMWLFDSQAAAAALGTLPELSKYRLRFIDWVHALLSVLVFVAVALRDKNVVSCFYPMPARETKEVLDIVPIGIGIICSLLFVVFPARRHGIGYPVTPDN